MITSSAITAPSPRSPRYQSLDLWRGAACLMVVIFHCLQYSRWGQPSTHFAEPITLKLLWLSERMWIGVTIFFVISGYCIAATADSLRSNESSSVATFFKRRFLRIYPPYLLAFALSALIYYIVESFLYPGLMSDGFPAPHKLSTAQWIGNLTLTEMWRPHFGGGAKWFFLGYAWTLSYEEQFYAVMGLTLLFARRYLFEVLAILTILIAMFYSISKFSPITRGFFFDGRWLYFSLGILLYLQLNYFSIFLRRATTMLLGFGVIAACWDFKDIIKLDISPSRELAAAVSAAFLFALLHPFDNFLSTAKILRPLHFCGTMCYSMYLIHLPFTKIISHGFYFAGIRGPTATMFITVPSAIAASVTAAWLFHRIVERRFMTTHTAANGHRHSSMAFFSALPLRLCASAFRQDSRRLTPSASHSDSNS